MAENKDGLAPEMDDQEQEAGGQALTDEEFFALPVNEEDVENVLKAVSRVRGADQFISLCNEIHRMAPLIRQRGLQYMLGSRSYLFSIDKGWGLNSSVNLLTALMQTERLFNAADLAVSAVLPPDSEEADVLGPVADAAAQISGRFVIIDISAWTTKAGTEKFRNFLLSLADAADDLIYVFRVPYMEQNVLVKLLEKLNDVLQVQPVSFVPLGGDQLREAADDILSSCGFCADEGAWELFGQRIAEEKSDGRFYGMLTLKKIAGDMIYQKIRAMSSSADAGPAAPGDADGEEPPEMICICADDLKDFVQDPLALPPAGEDLSDLICAFRIRSQIEKLLAQIQEDRAGGKGGPLHIRFIGRPGTGKTTVARIIGRRMKEKGMLSHGYFFEHSAADLLAPEEGAAAPGVFSICSDARGSVLFIDEIYRFTDGDPEGDDPAGESLQMLDGFMKRDNMLVILAGDEEEMNRLLACQPSLREDMPYELYFPDYSREELADIFMDMVERNHMQAGNGLKETVSHYFMDLKQNVVDSEDFSNARFVRNLFESAWSKSVMRAQMDGKPASSMEREDFLAAAAKDVEEYCAKQTRRPRPGYHIGLI